ncbi:hypothetical protein EYZ11_012197 [Aspergillus tanneri]|uniref:Uncharacterized protein n=1 Tax=Aspergillus tanneri TaxID=1220188 RepID=A0A4S3J687_9EURO|nr:hypothetical protein EYZ11_012197 [Aspergillus tanneri]
MACLPYPDGPAARRTGH